MKPMFCKKYPNDEVLLDEDGNCSLCGSAVTRYGECLYDAPKWHVWVKKVGQQWSQLSKNPMSKEDCEQLQRDFVKSGIQYEDIDVRIVC